MIGCLLERSYIFALDFPLSVVFIFLINLHANDDAEYQKPDLEKLVKLASDQHGVTAELKIRLNRIIYSER